MSLTFNGLNGLSFGDGSSQKTAASGFGFKNRIINGDMRIDQRNVGVSVTPSNGLYVIDRWSAQFSQSSKISIQQVTDAPTGFSYSSKITSLSSYSVTSSDYFIYRQHIEGHNCADFAFGTASASNIAVSFWAKSSLTGSFSVSVYNNDGTRSYPALYTINSANTWEYKTVIIPGSTNGTWGVTYGIGVSLGFGLGGGSSFSSVAGSWNTSGSWTPHATGATSLVGTSGATLQITGVQLEKSSTVTSYDYRPYNIEDILCKRYFEKSYDFNATIGSFSAGWRGTSTNGTVFAEGPGWPFSVVKRVIPTVVFYNAVSGASGKSYQVSTAASISVSARYIGTTGVGIIDYTSSGGQNSYYIHYTAEAEL